MLDRVFFNLSQEKVFHNGFNSTLNFVCNKFAGGGKGKN